MLLKKITLAVVLCGMLAPFLQAANAKEKEARAKSSKQNGLILITSAQNAWEQGKLTEYQLKAVLEQQRHFLLQQDLASNPAEKSQTSPSKKSN